MTGLDPPTGVTHPDPGVGTDGAVIPPEGPRTPPDAAALRATGRTAAEAGPVTGASVDASSWAPLAPELSTAVRRRPAGPGRISAERR